MTSGAEGVGEMDAPLRSSFLFDTDFRARNTSFHEILPLGLLVDDEEALLISSLSMIGEGDANNDFLKYPDEALLLSLVKGVKLGEMAVLEVEETEDAAEKIL